MFLVHFEGEKEAFVTVRSFSTALNLSMAFIRVRRGDVIPFHATEADAMIVEHKQ